MPSYITDNKEISSADSEEENSDEENCNEQIKCIQLLYC